MTDLSQDPDFAGAFSNQPANSPITSGTNLANDPDFAGSFSSTKNPTNLYDLANSYNKGMMVPSVMTPTSALQYGGQELSQTPTGRDILGLYANLLVPEVGIENLGLRLLSKAGLYGGLNAGLGAWNNPNNPMPSAIIGGVTGALTSGIPEIYGLGKAAASTIKDSIGDVSPLLKSIDPEEVASSVQASHDDLSAKAQNGFSTVSSEVNNRGISQIPSKYVDSDLIDQAADFFPSTKANNAMIEASKSGDYNALRNLQTSLWQRATKAMGSSNLPDQDLAEKMFDVRDQINNGISQHLIDSGNSDLAETLNNARADYRNLQETYYNKNLPTAIPKLVHPDIRKVPDNILDVLNENSVPMQRIRDANPDVVNALNTKDMQDNAVKVGKGLGWLGGIGATLAGLHHYL